MNRKQWSAMSTCFLVLGLFLIWWSNWGISALAKDVVYNSILDSITAFDIKVAVSDVIFEIAIILSFFLSILFEIIGRLEPEKKV